MHEDAQNVCSEVVLVYHRGAAYYGPGWEVVASCPCHGTHTLLSGYQWSWPLGCACIIPSLVPIFTFILLYTPKRKLSNSCFTKILFYSWDLLYVSIIKSIFWLRVLLKKNWCESLSLSTLSTLLLLCALYCGLRQHLPLSCLVKWQQREIRWGRGLGDTRWVLEKETAMQQNRLTWPPEAAEGMRSTREGGES